MSKNTYVTAEGQGGGSGGGSPVTITARIAEFLVNGATVIGKTTAWVQDIPNTSRQAYLNIAAVYDLAEGDYVEVVCFQNSGSDKPAGDSESFFGIQQIGIGSDHGALVQVNVQTNVPNNTLTPVSWGAENYDTDAYHDGGAPTKFTVPAGRAGKYMLTATILL